MRLGAKSQQVKWLGALTGGSAFLAVQSKVLTGSNSLLQAQLEQVGDSPTGWGGPANPIEEVSQWHALTLSVLQIIAPPPPVN